MIYFRRNDNALLSAMEQSFSNICVKEDEHFLKAVKLAAENGVSVVPVEMKKMN